MKNLFDPLFWKFFWKNMGEQIEALTNHQFTTAGKHFQILLYAQFYAALVIIALGTWYKRGVQLQKEQDLTI